MTIRDRIKELAIKEGISLPNLESLLGFGNGTILKWDKNTPNTDKLSKVADHFGVSVDYLLGREKEKSELENLCFSIAKEAQENGIDPDDIRDMIQIIKKARERK